MEVFDNKQTNWCGLWWHPEAGSFVSQAINLSALRKFKGNVKIVVRKNKFYNKGENQRPNYNFIIRDTASQNAIELQVEDAIDEEDEDRCYTYSEVQEAINGATRDAINGYIDNIVTDYLPDRRY